MDKEMENKMFDSIEKITGVKPSIIISKVQKKGLERHSEIIKYLKTTYGLTHGFANMLAHKSKESENHELGAYELISKQYEGKEHLRPILGRILFTIADWENIEVVPKKKYVSLRTKTQFGIVQPSTKSRVDLGLKLKGTKTDITINEAGSFNKMVTHRISLKEVEDIDKTVLDLLELAYKQSKH